MGFSRQKYWRGLPFPSPGKFPNPRIKLESLALAGGFFTTEPPGMPNSYTLYKTDKLQGLPVSHRELYSISCNNLQCKRIHTHTHTYLNHFPLCLKLTQHFFRLFITQLCKSTMGVCISRSVISNSLQSHGL